MMCEDKATLNTVLAQEWELFGQERKLFEQLQVAQQMNDLTRQATTMFNIACQINIYAERKDYLNRALKLWDIVGDTE